MTALKKSGLLRTYYRDRLRGYRLGARAKSILLDGWPERFASYLTGEAETNRLKSETTRRLRLHRLAETYVTMDNAGVGIYPDENPKVFAPQGFNGEAVIYPAFYSSREVKDMGVDTTQIQNSRFAGVLLSPTGIYATYNKPLETFDYEKLKDHPLIDATTIGLKGSPTNIFKSFTPPAKGVGMMLEGNGKETCEKLAGILADKHII